MNLLETLSKEIENKNWTTDEKARYLYLRSCELFTYDPRYKICNIIPGYEKLRNEILTKEIDIENIQNDWVVCTTHQKYIYTKLLKELLNIDSKIKKLNNESIHVWSEFNDSTRDIKADTTVCSDLFRIKLRLKTLGYRPLKNEINYEKKLQEIDKKIGYIKDSYQDSFFLKTNIELSQATKNYNKDEIILYKWQKIINMVRFYQQEKTNMDLHFCIQYLILHLLTPEERKHISTSKLFSVQNNQWYFMHIYTINLSDTKLYFALSRYENYYQIKEINENEANIYLNNMQKEKENITTLKLK